MLQTYQGSANHRGLANRIVRPGLPPASIKAIRKCWSSFDIVRDAHVGAEAMCDAPEHVARSLEHSDCKAKAPVSRREEQRDERLNL